MPVKFHVFAADEVVALCAGLPCTVIVVLPASDQPPGTEFVVLIVTGSPAKADAGGVAVVFAL